VESALDWLGQNPLDGVPFHLNPAFMAPTALLADAERLLALPLPAADALAHCRWMYDASVERRVIHQLQMLDEAKVRRQEAEDKRVGDFLERKKKEEEEKKVKEELERKTKEAEVVAAKKKAEEEEMATKALQEERARRAMEEAAQHSKSSSPSPEKVDKPPSAPPAASRPQPPAAPQAPLASLNVGAKASLTPQTANKINFSEFEAESDPFDFLELKSISNMQALASVLQTTPATTSYSQHQRSSTTTPIQVRPTTSQRQTQPLTTSQQHLHRPPTTRHQISSPVTPHQQQQRQQQQQQPIGQHQFVYQGQQTIFSGYGARTVPTFVPSTVATVPHQQQQPYFPYPQARQSAMGPAAMIKQSKPLPYASGSRPPRRL